MSKKPDLQPSFLKDKPIPELHVYNIGDRWIFPRPGHRANWENLRAMKELTLKVLEGEINLNDREEVNKAIAGVRGGRQPRLFE